MGNFLVYGTGLDFIVSVGNRWDVLSHKQVTHRFFKL